MCLGPVPFAELFITYSIYKYSLAKRKSNVPYMEHLENLAETQQFFT